MRFKTEDPSPYASKLLVGRKTYTPIRSFIFNRLNITEGMLQRTLLNINENFACGQKKPSVILPLPVALFHCIKIVTLKIFDRTSYAINRHISYQLVNVILFGIISVLKWLKYYNAH